MMNKDKQLYSINVGISISFFAIIILIASIYEWSTSNSIIIINDYSSFSEKIVTINSIICGFSLTNLSVLISISDDQLVKKLEGTSILNRRNVAICKSVIYGAISIVTSIISFLNINMEIFPSTIQKIEQHIVSFGTTVEVVSLIFSIYYFLISIKLMIRLLRYIYIPKKRYSDEDLAKLKEQLNRKNNYNSNRNT